MMALRFLSPDYIPTVLGILVLGKDPRQFIPGAYVQFLRLEGEELTDSIRDEKEISGPIGDQLRRLDEVLEAHNAVTVEVAAGPIEIRKPGYPPVALQQLTRNAILHRDYESTNAPVRVYWFNRRIEIHNPGGPFGQVTRANFGGPGITDYRNPGLAQAMHHLGYVQRFGMGILLAQQALRKNGNPPPQSSIHRIPTSLPRFGEAHDHSSRCPL
jgi:ATP-dependent DNA helicase RecG